MDKGLAKTNRVIYCPVGPCDGNHDKNRSGQMANQEQDNATDIISNVYHENRNILCRILSWRAGGEYLLHIGGVELAQGVITAKRKILKNVGLICTLMIINPISTAK